MSQYIVGIGASAGGLEALFSLLPHIKSNGNVGYVIAQHTAHDGHSDLMHKLLSRYANMEVVLAKDGQRLKSDHIYLIPAGSDGIVSDGCLHLKPPADGHVSTPSVNVLFQSLAQSLQAYAIGIVLSGTGSDGVIGCRAIKKFQGLTFAQDPSSAIFNGMPSSAIEAGVVDLILSPQNIAETIAQKIIGAPSLPRVINAESNIQTNDKDELLPILELVFKKTGINFVGYRTETLRRRLDGRMAAIRVDGLAAYYSYLKAHLEEIFHIQQLFLVSFSSFFRDAESFDVLAQQLLEVLHKKKGQSHVSIWVAGCASGEEVYTLAMVLTEIKLKIGRKFSIKVKGTDLNPIALEQARSGIYSSKAFKEMAPELIKKYFTQEGEHYVVNDAIQAQCEFEQASVFGCNQAGTVDLVSCRNLLIYLKSPLQTQLIGEFHQTLVPGGLLFLGQSESLSPSSHVKFKQVNLTHRLYMRR